MGAIRATRYLINNLYKSAFDLTDNARIAQDLPQLKCLLTAMSGLKTYFSLRRKDAEKTKSIISHCEHSAAISCR
jgi:hypothetical protein